MPHEYEVELLNADLAERQRLAAADGRAADLRAAIGPRPSFLQRIYSLFRSNGRHTRVRPRAALPMQCHPSH